MMPKNIYSVYSADCYVVNEKSKRLDVESQKIRSLKLENVSIPENCVLVKIYRQLGRDAFVNDELVEFHSVQRFNEQTYVISNWQENMYKLDAISKRRLLNMASDVKTQTIGYSNIKKNGNWKTPKDNEIEM